MSDEMFIEHCSPTLAGLKTGNMFSCRYASMEEIRDDLRRINRALRPKGLCALPLRFMKDKVLIYLFRPSKLDEDLKNHEAARLLADEGYEQIGRNRCLTELIRRMGTQEDFPHEVGLFLSYPPEDVRGFIENKASGCKLTGTWKVYGDEDGARQKFELYRRCTDSYRKQWAKGKSLRDLAVPCC
ncbi:MAG: DUF3793 family protein [Lachnospiraceae bacterium]|nr:DUF3793 family protein [Lachnospiraceae bacterium]